MDRVIEVNVDSGTLNAAEERLNSLGISVQEAVVRMLEREARGGSGESKIVERTISLSEARRKPGEVRAYIGELGRVILMTSHGRGRHAMMSVETYRRLRDDGAGHT